MKKLKPFPIVRLGIVLSIVCAAALHVPGLAAAHDVLTRTSPANGATLGTPPTYVEFEFDAEVKPSFATVVVTGPDGQRWDTGEATVNGLVVQAAVKDGAPAGAYTAAYRVVSSDSHPITGSIKYTVSSAAPAPATVTPSSAPPAPVAPVAPTQVAQPEAPAESAAVSLWPWMLGGFLLVAAAVVLIRRTKREDT